MIKEDHVSYDTANVLRDKGFNEICTAYYHLGSPGTVYKSDPYTWNTYMQSRWFVSAPTLQMVMKWLREVHGIFITIEIKGDPRLESFIYYQWSVAKYSGCQIERIDNGLHTPEDYWLAEAEEDEKYEYAAEAAIKYCLENLI